MDQGALDKPTEWVKEHRTRQAKEHEPEDKLARGARAENQLEWTGGTSS